MRHTLGSLLAEARLALARAAIDSPALDARLMLQEATGLPAARMVSSPDQPVASADAERFLSMVRRRAQREPLHRITGRRDFYGLEFRLNAHTLVPRPDTETLVDRVLPLVRSACEARGACRVLDIGTGSGAIAVSILVHEPRATAVGTDMSADALAMASDNASRHGAGGRFVAALADIFPDVGGPFDIIVSNPPYISSAEIAVLMPEVAAGDPRLALDGGEDGLAFYRGIADGASGRLASSGFVGLEFGHDQQEDVIGIMAGAGFACVDTARDLGGRDRVAVFRASG